MDDTLFQVFVEQAATCADHPVPSLLYQGKGSKVESRLGSLNVEAKWLSARPRSIDDITVCTNSDFDRLYMLAGQCSSWGGPVSAVVYLPLELFSPQNRALVAEAKRQLAALHAEVEARGDCTLDLVLVSEVLRPEAMWSFPYNSLRNQAIARTRTKLLILLDVDFLLRWGGAGGGWGWAPKSLPAVAYGTVQSGARLLLQAARPAADDPPPSIPPAPSHSANLRAHLLAEPRFSALVTDAYINLDVVVLPAFETKPGLPLAQGTAIAERAIQGTKKQVFKLFRAGKLVQFAPFFLRGHGPTEHKRWFGARQQYPAVYATGFEPFVLMSRVHVPWYDERFRGYGWDKITHIFQLARSGYNLMVHPTAFLVHRPHLPSAGYNRTFTGPAYTENHKPTDVGCVAGCVAGAGQDMAGQEGSGGPCAPPSSSFTSRPALHPPNPLQPFS